VRQLDESIDAGGLEGPYIVQRAIVREASGPPGYPGREVTLVVGLIGHGDEGVPPDQLRDELVAAAAPNAKR
jgi:hypothetical protein